MPPRPRPYPRSNPVPVASFGLAPALVGAAAGVLGSQMFGGGPYAGGYATHFPALATAVAAAPPGPVLEVGAGNYSTPLLAAMCAAAGRRLVTIENVPQWLAQFQRFASPTHELRAVTDWDSAFDQLDREVPRWALVFIDQDPYHRRGDDARRFAPRADLVVCHDTERDGMGWERLREFKYRTDYTKLSPYTTILSDARPTPRLE